MPRGLNHAVTAPRAIRRGTSQSPSGSAELTKSWTSTAASHGLRTSASLAKSVRLPAPCPPVVPRPHGSAWSAPTSRRSPAPRRPGARCSARSDASLAEILRHRLGMGAPLAVIVDPHHDTAGAPKRGGILGAPLARPKRIGGGNQPSAQSMSHFFSPSVTWTVPPRATPSARSGSRKRTCARRDALRPDPAFFRPVGCEPFRLSVSAPGDAVQHSPGLVGVVIDCGRVLEVPGRVGARLLAPVRVPLGCPMGYPTVAGAVQPVQVGRASA